MRKKCFIFVPIEFEHPVLTEAKKKVLQIQGRMFFNFTFLGLSALKKIKSALEQIIQTVKGQDNYGNRIVFL
jgi:hypothetical protein